MLRKKGAMLRIVLWIKVNADDNTVKKGAMLRIIL